MAYLMQQTPENHSVQKQHIDINREGRPSKNPAWELEFQNTIQ